MSINSAKDRLVKAFEHLRYLKKVSSQTDFGEQIGYNKSHVSELMNGKKPVTNNLAATLRTKFGIDAGWLITGNGNMIVDEPEKPLKKVPVLGEAAAGNDMQMTYNDNTTQELEYIDVGDLLRDSEAAFTVYGNSMNPNYPSGCILGIKRNYDGFIQPGEIYLLETKSNRVFKRLYHNEAMTAYVCFSDNVMVHENGAMKGKYYYPPFEVKYEDVIRLHDVTGMIKRTRNSGIIMRQK